MFCPNLITEPNGLAPWSLEASFFCVLHVLFIPGRNTLHPKVKGCFIPGFLMAPCLPDTTSLKACYFSFISTSPSSLVSIVWKLSGQNDLSSSSSSSFFLFSPCTMHPHGETLCFNQIGYFIPTSYLTRPSLTPWRLPSLVATLWIHSVSSMGGEGFSQMRPLAMINWASKGRS